MFLYIPIAAFFFILAAPFVWRGMIPAAALDRESHRLKLVDVAAFKSSLAFCAVVLVVSVRGKIADDPAEIAAALAAALIIATVIAVYANLLWRRWR